MFGNKKSLSAKCQSGTTRTSSIQLWHLNSCSDHSIEILNFCKMKIFVPELIETCSYFFQNILMTSKQSTLSSFPFRIALVLKIIKWYSTRFMLMRFSYIWSFITFPHLNPDFGIQIHKYSIVVFLYQAAKDLGGGLLCIRT